jgi:hypothetical protein
MGDMAAGRPGCAAGQRPRLTMLPADSGPAAAEMAAPAPRPAHFALSRGLVRPVSAGRQFRGFAVSYADSHWAAALPPGVVGRPRVIARTGPAHADSRCRLGGLDNREHFKVTQIAPPRAPDLEQSRVAYQAGQTLRPVRGTPAHPGPATPMARLMAGGGLSARARGSSLRAPSRWRSRPSRCRWCTGVVAGPPTPSQAQTRAGRRCRRPSR